MMKKDKYYIIVLVFFVWCI